MPQPLSKLRPDAVIDDASPVGRILQDEPELAMLALEAIASWSRVEYEMLQIYLVILLGPNRNEDGAAYAYLALETQSAKSAVINSVARLNLKAATQNLLKALLAIAKINQKSRDKLAHHVWVRSDDMPGCLLLADPKDLLRTVDLARVFVWRASDFKSVIAANERLIGYSERFRDLFSVPPNENNWQLFAQLCAEPEIRERLDRLA